MRNSKLAKFFGNLALGVVTIGVMLFLGKHSLNLFMFTFQGNDELFAWLGLLLTSGGVVCWLAIFMWLADSVIRRGVSITMMFVAAFGEFMTAGADMYLNSLKVANFAWTENDLRTMTIAVAALGLLTGLALIVYAVGDAIVWAFQDDDKDGKINLVDRTDNRKQNKGSTMPANAPQKPQGAPQQQNQPQHSLDEFLRVSGLTKEQARAKYADQQEFMGFASNQFSYISGGNMRRMHAELMGQGSNNNHPANPQKAAR